MVNIDESIKFIPINIGLLTISDTRSEDDDKSGNLLKERIENYGHLVFKKKIIPDNILIIKKTLTDFAEDTSIDAIITTGGTGLTGRDSTPEAIIALSDKIIDSFVEGVEKQAGGKSVRELEKIRDECLVAVQRVLAKHNMGAGKALNEFKNRIKLKDYEQSK